MKTLAEMKDAFYMSYLENEINILTNQLQEHKEKEDKLREYCNAKTIKTNLPLYTKEVIAESEIANNVLQILNEGSDGNE